MFKATLGIIQLACLTLAVFPGATRAAAPNSIQMKVIEPFLIKNQQKHYLFWFGDSDSRGFDDCWRRIDRCVGGR